MVSPPRHDDEVQLGVDPDELTSEVAARAHSGRRCSAEDPITSIEPPQEPAVGIRGARGQREVDPLFAEHASSVRQPAIEIQLTESSVIKRVGPQAATPVRASTDARDARIT